MIACMFCTWLGGTVGVVERRGAVESGGGGTSGIDETRGSFVFCKLVWASSHGREPDL